MKRPFLFALIISLLLLSFPLAHAAPLTIDLDTATYSELEEARALIEARMTIVYEEELASYQLLSSTNDIALGAGDKIFIFGTVEKVAEGLTNIQIIITLDDGSQLLASYVPSDTLPIVSEGDFVELYGVFDGEVSVFGSNLPAITATILERVEAIFDSGIAAQPQYVEAGSGDYSIQEYTWSTRYNNYAAIAVRNNTNEPCEASVRVVFKDESGSMLGVKDDTTDPIDAGYETILVFTNDVAFSSIETSVTLDPPRYYKSGLAALQYDVTTTGSKAIVTVTNIGSKPVSFVQCYALFFKNGETVYYDHTYATDKDYEIKAGKMEICELKSSEDFDSVQIYLTGRISN